MNMESRIYYDNTNITLRHDLVIDLLVDEVAELRPATEIEFVDGPGGQAPTVEDSSIRCSEPGRYRFRISSALGRQDLHVLVVADDALEAVRLQVRSLGHGDSGGFFAREAVARKVIKSLANHAEWFNGTRASLANQNLAPHGC
jgi:hypothetical protein